MTINQIRLREILDQIGRLHMAVLGDFCLDAYWDFAPGPTEIALETGKPTRRIQTQRYEPGGAANVANNLAALGAASVEVFGVYGPDPFGRELNLQLSQRGVYTDGLVAQQKNWDTHVFGKPHEEGEEGNRIDFGMLNVLDRETGAELVRQFERRLPGIDGVVINQQVLNSFYTPSVIAEINRIIAANPQKTFVIDSRDYSSVFRKAHLKINQTEAARLVGVEKELDEQVPREELIEYARRIIANQQLKSIFITRGERGLLAVASEHVWEAPGIQVLDAIDPVGAGDAAVSAVTSALAARASEEESAEFANFAATVTIRKLYQCGTASPEEIVREAKRPDFIHHPELAEDIRKARYMDDSEIEVIAPPPERGWPIRHAIFDHDGTISTLRQGWEQVMEPMMIRSILGDQYDSVSPAAHQKVARAVREYIDKSTGIQTINQMQWLTEAVRSFGFVPEDEIADRFEYKRRYNEALLQMVRQRATKLKTGELGVEDFTIKGSIPFLKELHERGVTLHLASGTDEEDVRREAADMGYADLFTGGIHGATGDIDSCSKQMVLERILTEEDVEGEALAIFGDGPVELREARRHGGAAIGVATDEIRRFGLNPRKRTRLIRAGSHLIIPDFSQFHILMERVFDFRAS